MNHPDKFPLRVDGCKPLPRVQFVLSVLFLAVGMGGLLVAVAAQVVR